MAELSQLEQEFVNEQKGEGSLSIFLNGNEGLEYLGYDLNPEDIEALYFEAIGIPRWESLEADSVEKQTELYWERFNEVMGPFPQVGRIRDTDETVDYGTDSIGALSEEIGRAEASASTPKAIKAVKKYQVALMRASEKGGGLVFKPSQLPEI